MIAVTDLNVAVAGMPPRLEPAKPRLHDAPFYNFEKTRQAVVLFRRPAQARRSLVLLAAADCATPGQGGNCALPQVWYCKLVAIPGQARNAG